MKRKAAATAGFSAPYGEYDPVDGPHADFDDVNTGVTMSDEGEEATSDGTEDGDAEPTSDEDPVDDDNEYF